MTAAGINLPGNGEDSRKDSLDDIRGQTPPSKPGWGRGALGLVKKAFTHSWTKWLMRAATLPFWLPIALGSGVINWVKRHPKLTIAGIPLIFCIGNIGANALNEYSHGARLGGAFLGHTARLFHEGLDKLVGVSKRHGGCFEDGGNFANCGKDVAAAGGGFIADTSKTVVKATPTIAQYWWMATKGYYGFIWNLGGAAYDGLTKDAPDNRVEEIVSSLPSATPAKSGKFVPSTTLFALKCSPIVSSFPGHKEARESGQTNTHIETITANLERDMKNQASALFQAATNPEKHMRVIVPPYTEPEKKIQVETLNRTNIGNLKCPATGTTTINGTPHTFSYHGERVSQAEFWKNFGPQ